MCALAGSRRDEERRAFADRLEDRLKQRLARDPVPSIYAVATFVAAKRGC